MVVKNAMMLCVGNKSWIMPKHVLIETDGSNGERLVDIANRIFEKYKNEQKEDIYLVDYSYYGNVEVV